MESNWGFSARLLEWLHPSGIFDLVYWVYVFTGCWTYHSAKQWKTNLYKAYQSFLVLTYALTAAFYALDAVTVVDDLEKLSFNWAASFLLLMTFGKVSLLVRKRRNLEDVYGKLNDNLRIQSIVSPEKEKNILKSKAEILSTIMVMFYTFLILGLPLRVIADTSLDPKAYLIPIPHREAVEEYYNYLYAPEIIIIFHFLVVVLSHDLLVFSVLIRLVAHYEILAQNFQDMREMYEKENDQQKEISDVLIRSRNDFEKLRKFSGSHPPPRNYTVNSIVSKAVREGKINRLLKEAIKYHQVLLRETNNFNRLYSLPLLVQSSGSGVLIAIVILQIFFISKRLNILLIEQIMFTVTLLYNVFFLCSFASELNTKSRMAADALYGTPWYEMDIKNRRIVQFAIKKMMEGPVLRGGRMIVINRETYLKFLRISYNVIAVLRHIY